MSTSDISESISKTHSARRRIGELALDKGLITKDQLKEALSNQVALKEMGLSEKLGAILCKKKWLTKKAFEELLSEQNSGHRQLGNFEIFEKIGQGAMGVVFRARQISMERIVALKILSPRYANDKEFIERFIREARAAGQFSHVNIVTAVDVGYEKPYYYFAMEYVEGENLRSILKKKGKLSEADTLEFTIHVAQALEHALYKNILHRDVKPENIMLTSNKVAKLLDMGLACAAGAGEEDPSDAERSKKITKLKKAIGTPHYISPEAARGASDLDTRADIYSLGCTFYHFLTGRTPYENGKGHTILAKHLTEPFPDIRKTLPGVSDEAACILERMTAKDKEQRYKNPTQLLEDLRAFQKGRVLVHAQPSSRSRRRAKIKGPKGHGKNTTGPRNAILPPGDRSTGPRKPITVQGTTGPRRPIRPKGMTTGPAVPVSGDKTAGQVGLAVSPREKGPKAGRRSKNQSAPLVVAGLAATLLFGVALIVVFGGNSGRSLRAKKPAKSMVSSSHSTAKVTQAGHAQSSKSLTKFPVTGKPQRRAPSKIEEAQSLLAVALSVDRQHPEEFAKRREAYEGALEAAKGTELEDEVKRTYSAVKTGWKRAFKRFLEDAEEEVQIALKKGRYEAAGTALNALQVPSALRCFEWEARMQKARDRLGEAASKNAQRILGEARVTAEKGSAADLKEALEKLKEAFKIPSAMNTHLAPLNEARKAWSSKWPQLEKAEVRAVALRQQIAMDILKGIRKELSEVLRKNQIQKALDRLQEHIANPVLAPAKALLKKEQQDLLAIRALRLRAIQALRAKAGQTISVSRPFKAKGKIVVEADSKDSIFIKLVDGPSVRIKSDDLSSVDVDLYAPKIEGMKGAEKKERAEDLRRRGLMFLAVSDVDRAEAMFKAASKAGLGEALKPYFQRIEILRLGESEVKARRAWQDAEVLFVAKKWKEARAAYRSFNKDHSTSKIFQEQAKDLRERLAKIESVLNPVKPGLRATYFKGKEFRKEDILVTRIDATIDFAWGNGSPGEKIPPNGFSARWDGLIKIDKPGTYSITIKVDDGGRFWVGDREMYKGSWKDQSPTKYTEKIELSVGWYPIRMEYYERGGGSDAHLYWALEGDGGFAEQVIPEKALFHSPGENARSAPVQEK